MRSGEKTANLVEITVDVRRKGPVVVQVIVDMLGYIYVISYNSVRIKELRHVHQVCSVEWLLTISSKIYGFLLGPYFDIHVFYPSIDFFFFVALFLSIFFLKRFITSVNLKLVTTRDHRSGITFN